MAPALRRELLLEGELLGDEPAQEEDLPAHLPFFLFVVCVCFCVSGSGSNLPPARARLGVYDPELGKAEQPGFFCRICRCDVRVWAQALAEQFPIAHGQSVKEGCCLRSLSDADTDPPTPPPVLAWPHQELLRGCRLHFNRLVKADTMSLSTSVLCLRVATNQDLNEGDLDKARLGLGHAFSRARMQLDPNRQETTP